jgi:predicted RNase H-like HicB family nuclease
LLSKRPSQGRKAAKAILGVVSQGEDPAKAREAWKAAITVSELADQFIEEHIGAKITREGETFKVEIIRD